MDDSSTDADRSTSERPTRADRERTGPGTGTTGLPVSRRGMLAGVGSMLAATALVSGSVGTDHGSVEDLVEEMSLEEKTSLTVGVNDAVAIGRVARRPRGLLLRRRDMVRQTT